jgi:hypothetical protein
MPIETTATPAATIASRTIAMSPSASNQCATGPKGPGGPGLVRMDDGWSRPPCGVMGSRGAGDRDRLPSGGPESPCSIRRVKPLRNYPLVWRKKRQRVSLEMLAERSVRPARNADGGEAVSGATVLA